jgi:cyanate permease
MEPGIREFFRRISSTIGLLIIWMAINIAVGIKYKLAFYEDKIHWYNIVFYIWAILSFAALIFAYIRIWKQPIEDLND